ncbi:SDR family NAD(P)-dependent oxidoreductase [Halocatena pleomorpha]|uniref:SDR family oxidoreductase n=1 Tax=Halocatena pleomorpha TaxID=1785090 RepID=A0A3P3RDG0_9EURY|nr:SDR family NAD(P)-dependent oxidoreductase [Halocatena pleomorpha]RRJ30493.1 SDR family oxidoreductase [Halocatena pleomorpha]
MSCSFEVDFSDSVVVVTGASGALGSAVVDRFVEAGATVCGTDIARPDDEETLLDTTPESIHFYEGDFTDETDAERVMSEIADDHGRIDALCAIAGTWRGGDPIEETDVETFDLLFDVNLKTMFLAAKHALPEIKRSEGTVVTVSSRSSLEGGEGDGPYRAAKAGVRRLTETIAAENTGVVRANAIMPSVIDTPANREAMPDSDHEAWVDPTDIADVVAFLCSSGATVTSGAAVPVYGTA